jgi:hypothetical protein
MTDRIINWSAASHERTTHTLEAVQRWRHVAWAGLSTGKVWALDDPEVKDDPAGFAPLWALLDDEAPISDEREGAS